MTRSCEYTSEATKIAAKWFLVNIPVLNEGMADSYHL